MDVSLYSAIGDLSDVARLKIGPLVIMALKYEVEKANDYQEAGRLVSGVINGFKGPINNSKSDELLSTLVTAYKLLGGNPDDMNSPESGDGKAPENPDKKEPDEKEPSDPERSDQEDPDKGDDDSQADENPEKGDSPDGVSTKPKEEELSGGFSKDEMEKILKRQAEKDKYYRKQIRLEQIKGKDKGKTEERKSW